MSFNRLIVFFLISSLASLSACKHDPVKPKGPGSGFPAKIAEIMDNQCATAGCHNGISYDKAGDLLLSQWSDLFAGGRTGAAVVPFSPQNSPLLYFINTHADLGPIATPTMPFNRPPLSRDQYLLIRDWIAAGAPDKDGNIAFAANSATRQKIYMTMQGCDLLASVDAEKRVVMRYIPIGKSEDIEAPHCVRVTKDGKFAYVSFLNSQYVQKISTATDSVVDEIYVGLGSWNVFHLSPDGKKMIICDWADDGKVLIVNLETKQIEGTIPNLVRPHGIATDESFETFYVTSEGKNVIYKFNLSWPQIQEVSIGNDITGIAVVHEIMMSPDHSRYLITLQNKNEVRVMDAVADTLIKIIPVGTYPQEIAISSSRPYWFVSCMEDASSQVRTKGSVYAINYNTLQPTKIEGPFYQPHAITVDDRNGTFYVLSRNANTDGPPPHHASGCSGRNGFYHVYDLNTFRKLPRKYEVTVEPYSADTRFK